MKNFLLAFYCTIIFSASVFSQTNTVQVILPVDYNESVAGFLHVPADGFNVYNFPNGEVVGRIRGVTPLSEFSVSLSHRNRRPSLIPKEALAPLANNCFALPVIQEKEGFVLLFDTIGPEHSWISIDDIKKAGFELKIWKPISIKKFFSEKGKGLLIPDSVRLKDVPAKNIAHCPVKKINLYEKANGKKIAELSRFCPTGRYSDGIYRMFILPDSDPNNCIAITREDLYVFIDSVYYIPYSKQEGDFVQVFSDKGNYWIDLNELSDAQFEAVEYKYFFVRYAVLRVHPLDIKNNLPKENPYADAKPVTEQKTGITTKIKFDGAFCEGDYCKVSVILYKHDPCLVIPHVISKPIEAWLMVVDENGIPLVEMRKYCDGK